MATQQTSSSAQIRRYQLSAAAQGAMAGFARLSLYDGRMQMIADGYAHIECQVPAGLYKITLKLNEGYKEEYVTVSSDQTISLKVPETSSAVIAEGFKTSHEYYTHDAERYSSLTTAQLAGMQQGSGSLFFFFRYPDEIIYSRYKRDGLRLSDHFLLLDAERRVISSFSPHEVREEYNQYGWMAFHTQLEPGPYYLYFSGRARESAWKERKGQAPREIPVQVFDGWQTQGFLTFRNGPVFSSMIFSLTSLANPERLNRRVQYELTMLEGILRKFANGIYYLPSDMRISLAGGKFDNPFLGIVAAYAYFKSTVGDQEDFFVTVMRNLGNLLGTATPDMQILNALAAVRSNRINMPPAELQVPGMFAPGFSLMLRQQDSASPLSIAPGSIAEKCLDRLYHDMLWTSYQPFAKPKPGPGSPSVQLLQSQIDGRQRLLTIPGISLLRESFSSSQKLGNGPSAHPKPRKPTVLNSWIAHSLADALNAVPQGQIPAIEALAASLQVTPNLLLEIADKVVRSSTKIGDYLAGHQNPELNGLFNNNNLQRIAQLAGRELPAG